MPVPRQLSYFELQEEIGRGGMGSVWRAKDPTLDREVAIKVLRDERAGDPKFVADFLQEARNAAAISHPHIAQVYLVGDAGGQYYIVMELLRGRSFRQILEAEGQLDEERALDVAIQVADALRAAYKRQMIHGDIKPANIFITEDQEAKVLDFGLAKLANVEVTDTGGSTWGSPYYISPERVGQKAEDFRSDVYSLGATLFHALAGRPPFDAEDPTQLAVKRLNEKPPLLRDLNPEITAKTEQVVNKMLNKSIMMRYLDYDALLADLSEAKTEAMAKRLGVDLHPEEFQLPELAPPPRKSRLPWIIVSVLGVIIIAALAFFFLQKWSIWIHQTHTLEISHAVYGDFAHPGGVRIDITAELKERVKDGCLRVSGFNDLAGDPAPYMPKQVRVEYAIDGVVKSAVVRDDQELRLPEDTSETTAQAEKASIQLLAEDAQLKGSAIRLLSGGGGVSCIGYWGAADDFVQWETHFAQRGTFNVELTYACHPAAAGKEYAVYVGDQKLYGKVAATRDWTDYATVKVGEVVIGKPGTVIIAVKPATNNIIGGLMNFHSLVLKPVSSKNK